MEIQETFANTERKYFVLDTMGCSVTPISQDSTENCRITLGWPWASPVVAPLAVSQ